MIKILAKKNRIYNKKLLKKKEELNNKKQLNNKFLYFHSPPINNLSKSFLKIEMDYFIPLGLNCNSALTLKESNLRYQKLPFDWMQATPSSYLEMLNDMKNNCLDLKICTKNKILIKKYNAWIPHEPNNDPNEIRMNYHKYFKRLHDILSSKGKNICIIITSYDKMGKSIIDMYNNFLKREYNDNNYYFLTVNIGGKIEINKYKCNLINNRISGFYDNGEWIGKIYNAPLYSFFKNNLKLKKNIK